MKSWLRFLFAITYTSISGQTIDSIVIRQVDSLIQVSRTLTGKSDFVKALDVNSIAEKLSLEKLGSESTAYGSCCFNHGRVLYKNHQYTDAEKWYLQSKVIREKTIGKEHPDYAWSLNNLGLLYLDKLNYLEAEPFLLESKAIRERVLGKDHVNYIHSLEILARLYTEMSNYEKAEPYYIEAISIRKKVLGAEHLDYGQSLNSLANLYRYAGNYEKAESLYLESKAIREKAVGKEHPEYALCLNNLAVLYTLMGNFEKAEPYYLGAKTIFEKTLGKEHPNYAASLNNLGNHYRDIKNYEKAVPFFLEATVIYEKSLGKVHPDYAMSLNNLANIYFLMGDFKKAETLYLESVDIWGNALGKEHPDYANAINNLGTLYYKMNNSKKAEQFYLEAKIIREKTLGREHPTYVSTINNLAIVYFFGGAYGKSESYFKEVAEVNRKNILSALHHLSEKELNQYLLFFEVNQAEILSFKQNAKGILDIENTCYDNTLFFKGFLLNAYQQSRQLVQSNSVALEKYNLLKSIGSRLAVEYAKPIIERKDVAELGEKSNVLEKEIAGIVSGYGEMMKQVKWEDVQQQLKSNEAAIEFVHYRFDEKDVTDSIMYAALVLTHHKSPQFIPLFEVKELTALLKGKTAAESLSSLYASRGATPLSGVTYEGLYELIWKPLDTILQNVRKIYYSSSGLLHRINFDAMVMTDNKHLCDKYELIRLGSTRSLVVTDLTKVNDSNSAVIYGGINYNIDDKAELKIDSTLKKSFIQSEDEISFASASRSIRGRENSWNYLPGTETEIQAIRKIFKKSKYPTISYQGVNASEESFKLIGKDGESPKILHIATHGYFFPDPKTNSQQLTVSSQTEIVFKISDHPMIRSGLLLAGANYAWKTGRPYKEGMEDGILTAYEISQMNLSNTELVVLSACETGLGDIQGNEGVYGLQRAFKIAGAKYLIMSLWQVPDKQTSLLMTTFYKKWLEEKMSIPDAFHASQKQMRDNGLDPYNWAGFVLVD